MSRLRTVLYLVAMFALLAAMFGSLASPVQADDGGPHHGDDHKGDDHKKDKPAPDPTDPPPTFEVTPTRLPTDTPEPTGTTPPPLEATATPAPAQETIPDLVPTAPPVPAVDPAAYQIAVRCTYYKEKDATACRFAVESLSGGVPAKP